MNSEPVPLNRHQSFRRAPRTRDRCRSARSRGASLQGEAVEDVDDAIGVDDDHVIASASRVNSSITFNIFKVRPRRSCRTGSPSPRSRSDESVTSPRRRHRYRSNASSAALHDPQALLTPQTADALVVDLPARPARHLGCPRHPQRGLPVENRRSQTRNSAPQR